MHRVRRSQNWLKLKCPRAPPLCTGLIMVLLVAVFIFTIKNILYRAIIPRPPLYLKFDVLMKISISMIQSVVCMHYYFVRQSLTREWYDSNWSVERGQGLIFHISRMKNFWSMAGVEGSVLTGPCQQCNHGRNIRQQCVQVWILKKSKETLFCFKQFKSSFSVRKFELY